MTLSYSRLALALVATTAMFAVPNPALAQMPKPNFAIHLDQPSSEAQPTADPQDAEPREKTGMPPPAPEAVESRPLDAPAIVRRTAPAPRTVTRTITTSTVTGRVVDADGPAKTHKVKSGDNLDAIARAMGVDHIELAKLNGLKSPYRLQPGQLIKGPHSDAKAYVVGRGDTLYGVAQRFSVTAKAMASANDISVGKGLSPGRKLVLPEGYRDKGPIRTKSQVVEQVAEVGEDAPPAPRKPGRGVKPVQSQPQEEATLRTTTTTQSRVTGKVVEFAGKPISYRVRKGDALDGIAREFGMTRKELAEGNGLKAPYALQPGQVLKGPPEQVKGYVPVEGDTLALIAKRFNVTPKALAAMNGMRAGAGVKPGKRLTLPSGFRDKGPIKETIRTISPESVPTVMPPTVRPPTVRPTPTPYVPQAPIPYRPPVNPPQPPPTTQSGPLSDAQISSLGRGRFVWPLRGEVISSFGPKGTGQRNDGINLRAQPGDTVRAAAGGDVVYAGDQVPGFGNLVLVKHADGWVTAYGHLARIDVKMQQRIVQGQQLGQAGETGGVSGLQLHFEVRYAPSPTERARPIDPQLVLGR